MLAAVMNLTGCARVDLLNALIPTGDVTIERDIAYGPGPRQRLDVYHPRTSRPDAPVIVFFYGGTWQTGSKRDYLFAAQSLASTGSTVVVPDYRVYPEATFPLFLDDAASATAWTIRHLADRASASRPVFVAGHSAGAYIAVMVALDDRYLRHVGLTTASLAGAIGISGPYDFLPLTRPDVKPIFEVVPDLAVTQPIHFARSDAPPLLLVTGSADSTVGPYNTQHLADRMRALGGTVEDRYYPDVDHVDSVLALTYLFRNRAPVLADIRAFIGSQTAAQSGPTQTAALAQRRSQASETSR